ncbi:ABC transporter substrate-binding protein [Corynebacterium ulcerans]|uniref:ABC transporter substrate-binding protein n=1 Tax=Corynebacterium ulcerans TaxID=65058 RepID=UPI0036F35596
MRRSPSFLALCSKRSGAALLSMALAGSVLVACGDPSHKEASGEEGYPSRIVLADREAGDGFHPATGYGQTGVSPVYDGLLRPESAGPDRIPNFVPALASAMPEHNADATEWTVKLREEVKFSDGSDFDAQDVKASYDMARNIDAGSQIVARYEVIKEVEVKDPHTVVFKLNHPLAEMNSRLLYAIAPSEKLKEDGPITKAELNTKPVGTGAYKLVENRGDEVVFKANEDYWGGAPQVKEIVVTTASDDAARAQRVAAGEVDGAAIPPAQVNSVKGKDGIEVVSTKTADWRGISFPKVPELQDVKVRQALNFAVDRQAFVDGPLGGYGTTLETLISPLYGDAHDSSKTFGYDVAKAEKLLDEAGWKKNAAGMREKDGKPFHITLYYASSDTTRRDIAIEFASQMKKLGLDFETKAGTWDEIGPALGKAAAVLGGGSAPYDVTIMAYEYLHTRTPSTSKWANPGDYGSEELNKLLDEARSEVDTTKRNKLWQKAQAMYMDDPSALCLLNLEHVYASKRNEWKKPENLLEPHIHGATWGPWWRVAEWTK